ncbi:MAG: tetratricopeptide repeat protein [Anaerolineales bacterium]|jgi:tetratricopeptide (TPR) repeat protein
MTVRVETDIPSADTGTPPGTRLLPVPGWALFLCLVFALVAGLALMNGPDLLVSYANRFDGGTWSIPRPGFALPILNAELNLSRYMDDLERSLAEETWTVGKPVFLAPLLDAGSELLPGIGWLQNAASEGDLFSFEPAPLTNLLGTLNAVIPEHDRIQAVIDLEVWEFLNPDITSELLNAGLWIWPNSAELHDALGQYYLNRDMLSPAEAQFKQALNGDSELALVRNNLGVALISRGSFPEAVQHLRKAAELDPGNARVFFNLGDVYLKSGELEQAAEAFQRAVDLDPQLPGAWTLHGITNLYLEDFEQAQASFLNALAEDAQDYSARLGLGVVAMSQERYEEAYKHMEAASKALPADAVIRLYLGQVLENLDKPQDAIIEFERALLLSDDPVLTGMSYAHLENLRRALSAGNHKEGGGENE